MADEGHHEEEYQEEEEDRPPPTEEENRIRRKFDITCTVAKYLDKQLLYPVLMHAIQMGFLTEEEGQNAELDLLAKTQMVDLYKAKYCEYKGISEEECPEAINNKREEVLRLWKKRNTDAKQFLDYFGQEDEESKEESYRRFEELESQAPESEGAAEEPKEGEEQKAKKPSRTLFNRDYLEREFSITDRHLNALYLWAKLQYEVGQYAKAADYLFYYRKLGQPTPLEWDFSAKWGKLAAEIMTQQWPQAKESAEYVAKALDDAEEALHSASPATSAYKDEQSLCLARAWLMHWQLFIFFNEDDGNGIMLDDGLDKLVESWLPDFHKWTHPGEKERHYCRWLRVITCLCPHLLRYVTAACVIGMEENGKRRDRDGVPVESGHIKMRAHLKDVTRIIEAEKRYYRDPIVEFVEKLQSDCDFEGAHQKLVECEALLDADFFLQNHKDRFLLQGRKMIFENKCKIHSIMDIDVVARQLDADRDTAERYIVKMIRSAALDAKIDSENNQVILASQGNNIYKQVREKTKLVRDRTDQLIERLQDRRTEGDEEGQEAQGDDRNKQGDRRPQLKKANPAQRRRGEWKMSNFKIA